MPSIKLKQHLAGKTKINVQGKRAVPNLDFNQPSTSQLRPIDTEETELQDSFLSKDSSFKAYMRELKKVIELSDVIMMVLDARDPLGCFSQTVELEIQRREAQGKKLILILNKIDLVPKQNVKDWLVYLRKLYPTIPFKSSTQQQRTHLSIRQSSKDEVPDRMGAECLGADVLLDLLKNYARRDPTSSKKSSITVGIVGFPNVGKSSVVNSLKRSKACGVGAMPGFTKVMQEVVLDKNIKLLDSPGVVFAEDAWDDGNLDAEAVQRRKAEVLLRNVIKVELVDDPFEPVELILSRCSQAQMQEIYDVPEYTDGTDFLVKLALIRGKLGKGGVPDRDTVARQVLRDYNTGKIPYHTQPPLVDPAGSKSLATAPVENASIVTTGLAPAFDLGELFKNADQVLDANDRPLIAKEPIIANEPVIAQKLTIESEPMELTRMPGPIALSQLKRTEAFKVERKVADLTADVIGLAKANPLSRANQKRKAKQEAKSRKKRNMLPIGGSHGEGALIKGLTGLGVVESESDSESASSAENAAAATAPAALGHFGALLDMV